MEYKPEDQVFAFDGSDDVDPAEMYKKMIEETKQSAKPTNENQEKSHGVKRKFKADNGINYVWDDEEDCWVVDEENDDEDDDDDENTDDDDIEYKYKQAVSEMNRHNVQIDDDPSLTASVTTTKTSKTDTNNNPNKKKKKSKKNKKNAPNNWIYITGLPKDITIDEIKSHFSKVGLIALSPMDQSPKIKLYKDEIGEAKGDCSLCFYATESVDMAISYLDGGYIRPSHMIKVTKAEFEVQKLDNAHTASGVTKDSTSIAATTSSTNKSGGVFRPKISHAQVKTVKSAVSQALSWNEDDDIGVSKSNALKIVVLQNMFQPADLDDPSFLNELEEDIASECSKCGIIEKITVFSRNKNGVVIIKYKTSYAANECVKLMDGRFFGGQKIRSYFWDGVTDFTVAKSETLIEKEELKRLDEFGDYLDNQELSEEFQLRTEDD